MGSRGAIAAAVSLLPLLLLTGAAAEARTFTVRSVEDVVDLAPGDGECLAANGRCTLRAAVQEANAFPGADVILLGARTYRLAIAGVGDDAAATGDLDVTGDLEIRGEGRVLTVVDARGLDRVLAEMCNIDQRSEQY